MRRWSCLLMAPALLAAAPATREMSLKTPDGYTIKGTLTLPEGKGRKPVVVLAHQFRSDRNGWTSLATELHARGIATLALDLRGHGSSTDKAGQAVSVSDDFVASAKAVGFDRIPGDLAQAVKWVRTQPGIHPRRLGLAGSSVGGFSVLLAAAKVQPDAVLALSPAGSIAFGDKARVELKEAVQKAFTATFVMSSEEDGDAAENLQALRELPGVYAKLLKGKDHGFAYLPEQKDTMAVFFGEYLNHPHRMVKPAESQTGKPEPKADSKD